MPRAEPPLLGVGCDAVAPKGSILSAFTEIGNRKQQQGCPCTWWDVAAGVVAAGIGIGLVLGLAYALYPQGFACQTEERAKFSSGTVAAIETLVACGPVWGRATVFVSIAIRTWPGAARTSRIGDQTKTPVAKRSLLERQRSGWVSIVGGDSTWSQARSSQRMTQHAAICISLANLLLWHWSQPVSYCVVLEAYKCYPEFMNYDSIGVHRLLACVDYVWPRACSTTHSASACIARAVELCNAIQLRKFSTLGFSCRI